MTPDSGPTESKGQPGIVSAALSGLCPRCGARTLFATPAGLADECASCGLDFLSLERGGRFVGVLTMLLALVLILAALGVDEWLRPPLWASLLFWGPVTVGAVILALRLWKTMWVYHQYEERAE
ncbi:DUF983 domain-containing protein [Erythrobacter sp. sf7]|uniref:DUF983 domain-containing protein n=1 Tax=Erythrobacter fulvus TaxID=2987523 RepID=A0ABT5JR95_9SPHN|nr:DUF983 domain-containing protein [Erythrobacter fulvus]MDC8755054.1 DUF983 domain-containing protein [Erythrobacter fulvus]